MAKSGVAAAMLLHKLGAFVTVNDKKPLSENPEAQGLLEQGIKVICGEHPLNFKMKASNSLSKIQEFLYKNPMIEGEKKGIPLLPEVELAYQISEAPFIGITGLMGKQQQRHSSLKCLNEGRRSPLIAGNIGTVASGVAEGQRKKIRLLLSCPLFN